MEDERWTLVFSSLQKYLKKEITVKLSTEEEIVGKLVAYDIGPNLVIEKCDGKKKSTIICVGNNVMSIALGKPALTSDK